MGNTKLDAGEDGGGGWEDQMKRRAMRGKMLRRQRETMLVVLHWPFPSYRYNAAFQIL